MPLLEIEAKVNPLSPSWLFRPSWDARVADLVASFNGQPYNVTGSAVIVGTRAVVYIDAPDNVTTAHLDGLRRNWSERVPGLTVDSVQIVDAMPTANATRDRLGESGIFESTVGAVGDILGAGLRPLAVPLTLAIVAGAGYLIYRHSKGSK